ncbi:hypothetical protein [Halorhabdus rudnickae]|uniref:hypothetical protein n=1 Tax=Halorhabdus rudnickae TaxID=1775544 RepID=UPI001083D64A|nr:hypothetical protein [Halorhabdus rudnickae]
MGFSEWATETIERFQEHSFRFAAKRSGQELLTGLLRRVPGPAGDPIWDREWDVLVILDACRYDVFSEQYGDAEWLDHVEPVTSVGSASPEWMEKTFTEEYHEESSETMYVTGNPYSESHLPDSFPGHVDEVWRYVWDKDVGTIPPEALTNVAVEHYRSGEYNRLIIHYMQPHWPYISDPIMYGFDPSHITGNGGTENPFDKQNRGEISSEEHMKHYVSNLEHIVEHLRTELLTAIDAETVVLTADHATLFGDYGLYKHPVGVPLPVLRRVPWAVTSASNSGTFEPTDISKDDRKPAVDRDEQLRDLGYL